MGRHKIDISPIGVTDAEMRVYSEYLSERTDILDKIKSLKKEKEALIRGCIKSSSFVDISKQWQKDWYHDYMADFIMQRDAYTDQISGLQSMMDTRVAFCARIEERLKKLDTDDYDLVTMRYLDKLSLEDIAEKTHSNRQTVNDRIHKLLKFQLN